MVFVVEKRTTKYLPMKRLVVATARPGCMGVWFILRDHRNSPPPPPRKILAIRYYTVQRQIFMVLIFAFFKINLQSQKFFTLGIKTFMAFTNILTNFKTSWCWMYIFGTIRKILNPRLVISGFNSQPRGSEQSDWSVCRPHPLYPSTVPHVISSAANLHLGMFSPKERLEWHSKLARDKT